jgi:hypothetical protein
MGDLKLDRYVPWGWLYKSLRHLKSALPVLIPMLDLKSTQFDGGLEFYWWPYDLKSACCLRI